MALLAKTRRAANTAYVEGLRRVASCVSDRPLIAVASPRMSGVQDVAFAPLGVAAPLRTRHGPRGVSLSLVNGFTVDQADGDGQRFEPRTAYYAYEILDPDGRELLAYHWHPEGESPVTYPHLHLTSRVRPIALGAGLDPVALAEMHLPTGPIRLADVVRLLIAEFGAAPRRPDWVTILAAAEP